MTRPSVQSVSPNRLRKLREKAKVTQQLLADVLGVHRTTIARWEAGIVPMPRAAQISAHWFFAQARWKRGAIQKATMQGLPVK